MKTVAIKLADASHAQLKDHAETTLGIALGAKPLSREQLLAKVRAVAGDVDTIDVPLTQAVADPVGTPPAPTEENEDALVATNYQDGEKLTIQIDISSEPGGDKPVFVGVNGVTMLIARGKPQAVALPYVEVLENAIKTVWTQNEQTGDLESRDVPLYPFRVLREGSAARRAA